MKTSPNFKYYQKVLYKAEGVRLRSWVNDRVPPPTVWAKLGLDGVAAPRTSRAFKTYVRYVEKYDKRVFKNGYEEFFPRTATDMDVHLKVWAKTNRPDAYVLQCLKILSDEDDFSHVYHRMVTHDPIKPPKNYPYLKKFLKLREEMPWYMKRRRENLSRHEVGRPKEPCRKLVSLSLASRSQFTVI